MKKIFIFLLAFTVTMGVTVYSDAALWDRGGRPHLKPTDLSMSLSNAENQNISKEDQNKIKEVFGQRPISFIENRGQLDSRVKYYAKQGGSTIYFTENEIVFDFVRQKKNAGIQEKNLLFPGKAHEINKLKNIEMERQVIRMKLEQANPHPEILANNKQKGIVNYIIGNDPSKWRTNIPTFSIVYYKDVYAGIDLRFYASAQGSLEYDFIVHPGADPNKIMVAMEGIKRMEQDDKGDLHIWTGWGEIRQKSPKMFQTVDGKKIEVTGKFQITNNTKKSNQQTSLLASYGFKLGNYDKHHKVVVDPVIVYSTYLGGSSHEVGRGITVDQSGNVYVTGYTYSSDFPMVNALYPILDSGYPGYDAFIVKLNPRGTDIIYSTYLGGNAGDEGYGIAVDESGNACIAGITRSSNFPTVNPLYPNYAGDGDVFIFKLNASGTAAVYSTYLGGSAADELQDFAIDTSGNAYVTGYTASLNFPTVNALYPNYGGGEHDAFIFKMNPSGTGAVYSTYLGGSNDDNSCGIAVDDSGNAYVVGETGSLNFPTVNALYPNYGGGEREGFIFKMNPNGTEAVYSTYLGGSGQYDAATGIAVDSFGSVYVTGRTDSLNFPMVNALYPTRMGGWWDAFIFKMNPSGTEIVYSTYLGGSSNYDDGRKITVDHSGNAYVAGLTGSSDFPMVNALYPNFGGGEYDAFIFVMKPNGTEAVYSTYLGGSAKDSIMDIAVDGSGNIYVTGVTTSTDFPIVNALYPSFGVGGDGFIVKVSPTPVVPNQPPTAKCQNISVTASPSCNTAASIDNGSSDPDGDKITLSQTPTEPYLLGNTLVTLTVTDSVGASSQCTGMVTVADNTPPTIGDISANPSVLLPTNKMVNVAIDYVPADCQQVSCQISNVTSNQKMKSSDYVIVDAHHVKLKAVKGRIYAIAISCRDASGNSSSQTVTVTTTKR